MTDISLCLICALSNNYVIGRDNQLPWRLPADLAHFKQLTLGHPIIMGRKTFDSIGRPLPGRANLVVTRQAGWSAEGVDVVHSLEQALNKARELAHSTGKRRIYLIGGAELYAQALPLAQHLELTWVDAQIEGDAFFPQVDPQTWVAVAQNQHSADQANLYAYTFASYDRR
jgi:dihydrofolate reductase